MKTLREQLDWQKRGFAQRIFDSSAEYSWGILVNLLIFCSIPLINPMLEKRRVFLSINECYKTVFGLNCLQFNGFFEFRKIKSTRANHKCKIYVKTARVNCYKKSTCFNFLKNIENQKGTWPLNFGTIWWTFYHLILSFLFVHTELCCQWVFRDNLLS